MGAIAPKLDRKAVVEAQALGVVRQVLGELGGSRGLQELAARGPQAHLERELGLGSLERVELMLRLGDACGVRLPDRVAAEADTVQDLIDAILAEELGPKQPNDLSDHPGTTAPVLTATTAATRAGRDIQEQILQATTLTEVI